MTTAVAPRRPKRPKRPRRSPEEIMMAAPLPPKMNETLASFLRLGARVAPEDVYQDTFGYHVIGRTDRVVVHARSGSGTVQVTIDGRRMEPPARFSGVCALLENPDALLPEHIGDGDTLSVEVSGDHGETWETLLPSFSGVQARKFITATVLTHHGHIVPETGALVIRSTYLHESFGRHAWRLTRLP